MFVYTPRDKRMCTHAKFSDKTAKCKMESPDPSFAFTSHPASINSVNNWKGGGRRGEKGDMYPSSSPSLSASFSLSLSLPSLILSLSFSLSHLNDLRGPKTAAERVEKRHTILRSHIFDVTIHIFTYPFKCGNIGSPSIKRESFK